VAAFEERAGKCQVVAKFIGALWATDLDHSPLDVVAWHGDYVPYKYDLARFMAINTVMPALGEFACDRLVRKAEPRGCRRLSSRSRTSC
jgi:hypothetical protein